MTVPHGRLPLPLSSFIGREREIAEVERLLSTARFVTLTGAGGCGKTALALRIATARQDLYSDGVWWVGLAPLSEPALLPQAFMQVLGLAERPRRSATDTLLDFLRKKELLLIIDNCEHMVDACAQLAALLLEHCPDLHILATSREALNIDGEHIWIVPSLEFPRDAPLHSASSLQQYDAVRLFVERASAVQASLQLTDQNAAAIAHICQRVDGIPLAIELAAARVKVLSVEEIDVRLDDALRLLTEGKRTAPSRHQTLRATMDWSHGLLSSAEQILFRRLAVFTGGFTLEAAESISATGNLERDQVLNALSRLVDKSLVVKQEQDGIVRYRMLEPTRQYALQRLEESGDTESIRSLHLQYYLTLAETAEPKLMSVEREIWRQRLEADYDNMRAALEASQTADNPELLARLAGALAWFWYLGNYQNEGRQWLERALASVETTKPGTAAQAKALLGAGRLVAGIGPFELARARLTKSVALFEQFGDPWHAAYALNSLGYTNAQIGDYATAREPSEKSVAIARDLGDEWLLAFTLAELGNTLAHLNDPSARAILEEALALAYKLGEKLLIGRTLANVSGFDLSEGNLVSAHTRREEMLRIYRELGSKHGMALALGGMGDIVRAEGDYDRAAELYEESLALYVEVGLSRGWNLHNLGTVAQHRGNTARALELFKQSFAERRQEGSNEGMADALAGLAGVAAEAGQPLRAARLFGAAEALRDPNHHDIKPYNRAPYDLYLPLARARVDEKTFTTAWSEGRAMTLDQAIAEAEEITVRPHVAPVAKPHEPNALTPRELEVLRLIVKGFSDAQIADKLVISRRTVNAHLTAIYSKLGVSSRVAASHYALDHKLA